MLVGVLPLLRSSSRTGSKCQLGLGGAALARPLLGSPTPGKLRRWQQQLLLLRLSICPGRPQTNGDTNMGVSNLSANIMSWRVINDNIIIFQILYISILENEGLIWPIKRKCHQLVLRTILFVDEVNHCHWSKMNQRNVLPPNNSNTRIIVNYFALEIEII